LEVFREGSGLYPDQRIKGERGGKCPEKNKGKNVLDTKRKKPGEEKRMRGKT